MTFPPGPQGDSWIDEFNRDRLAFFVQASRQYGDLVHLGVGKKRHLFLVSNPDYIRQVLIEQPEHFHRGTLFKRRAGRLIGKGLLTSEGEVNARQRRLMQPAFHRSQIASYAEIMTTAAAEIATCWSDAADSGIVRDVHHDMTVITMNIVARALFGTDVSADVDTLSRAVTEGIEYLNDERLPEPTEAIAILNDLIARLMAERRAEGGERADLLGLLMAAHDEHGQMTDEQLRDEIITLFIAGHETSANALTWLWLLLAENPDIEAKLGAELESVLAGRDPSLGDVPRLPYTEMVVKESLRLYPTAWNQTREVMADVQFGPYTVPKGSTIMISPFVVQRNPAYFPDPECFRPERFADGEARIPRGAYQPFSAGPRVCIGQPFALLEMQLIVATLARQFRPRLMPGHEVEVEAFIALRPRGGLPMSIARR